MLGLGVFRKHGVLLLAGVAAVTTTVLLYRDFQSHRSVELSQRTRRFLRRDSVTNRSTRLDEESNEENDDAQEAGQLEEEDDDEGCADDPTSNFKDVMDNLCLSRLSQIALKLRIDQIHKKTSKPMSQADLLNLTNIVYSPPLCGSFNLAHKIVFNDGEEWFVRVPGHGMRFGDLDVQKMDSEYHTMRYIRANTDIPLPDVIFWSTATNLIGVPFAIVSAIEGQPLALEWGEMTEEKRCTVLEDAARHMSQLKNLSFDEVGALRFSRDGVCSHIGPRLRLKSVTAMEMINAEEDYFKCTKTIAQGPYHSLTAAFLARIEAADNATDHIRQRSDFPILRAAIDTMPSELSAEKRFCLNMPDLDWQNIFVGSDGRVTGFIDWDTVSSDASIGGYARVPTWLCADWNPVYYDYDADAADSCGTWGAMSPEDHRKYRDIYGQAMATWLKDVPEYDSRMSNLSHVITAIDAAIEDDFARQYIVVKLLKEADVSFTLFEYTNDFVAGDASVKNLLLREAFSKAWEHGWDTAKVEEDKDLALKAELELALKEESNGSSSCFEVLEADEESSDN